MSLLNFFENKKILLTGHTGFKGSWLSKILIDAKADVIGYALEADTEPSLFKLLDLENQMISVIGDIRDYQKLKEVFDKYKPEIVIHMAAQPLVRESYKNPVYTYETNVLGTVYLCECVRQADCVKSFLNVTTDKVYLNIETDKAYKEDDPLDGYDPYSNSKSCSELVTHSYISSFFNDLGIPTSTARAGNVIGGGDFSEDRILPDCIKAAFNHEIITVRNPYSVRPYQHVLEPLASYLLVVKLQYEDEKYSGYYNIGPNKEDCVSTKEIVDTFCSLWGNDQAWEDMSESGPHEAGLLMLDNSKFKKTFNWQPIWNIKEAMEKTVEWSKALYNRENINKITEEQINIFFEQFAK